MPPRALATTLATLLLAGGGVLVPTSTAHGEPRVEVAGANGKATASASGDTALRVTGSGFQSVRGGFGGIYVFFGWVDNPGAGTWRPSSGGVTGTDYRYVPDTEGKQNKGYQRFVAFPGSDTEYAANGGVVSASGRISLELVVPGATFRALDRNNKVTEVDCLKVQCGVITIGAHGVKNAQNETFTPVEFTGTASGEGSASSSTKQPATTSGGAVKAAKPAKAAVTVDPATAVTGRVLSFTGRGFIAGEQIIATFDDGVASVGPLTAGASGEIAGVLQLPEDTTSGTHTLRLTAAASGAAPTQTFAIRSDPDAPATAAPVAVAETDAVSRRPLVFAATAALILLLVAGISTRRIVRHRRLARQRRASAPVEEAVR